MKQLFLRQVAPVMLAVVTAVVLAITPPTPVHAADEPAGAADGQPSFSPFVFEGNGYDFVLFVCRARAIEVAVDPEVIGDLSKEKVEIIKPSTASGSQLLRDHLQSKGYVMYQVPLTAARKVVFLSSAPAWAHYSAMDSLRRSDYKAAYNSLKSVESDTSDFGKHCGELRKAMDEIMSRNAQMTRIETEVQRCMANYRKAKSDLETAKMAAGSANGGAGGILAANIEAKVKQAEEEGKKAWEAMNLCMEQMKTSNEQIGQVFVKARALGYAGEARFLFENLYASYAKFRGLLGGLQREGLATSEEDLSKMPEQVTSLREDLRQRVDDANSQLRLAVAAIDANDPDRARAAFERTYWLDATSPLGRLGVGLIATRDGIDSLNRLFEPVSKEDRDKRLAAMELLLREREKIGQLRALVEVRTGKPVEGNAPVKTREATLFGLAVRDGRGSLLPVSVHIESVPSRAADSAVRAGGYWESLLAKEIAERDWPVTFGDYGNKDPFMQIAAIEAYKWLRSIDGALRNRTGLRVEFEELLAGKGGDSAGVTIAVGGYSALRRVPLRQDVAMTGSVRSDGAVKAVGAVPQKILGAIDVPQVELIIVPRENEADLLTLPAEVFCRVVVVVADDIVTYLKYATMMDEAKPSKEQQAAWEAIDKLRRAQLKMQLGQVVEAQEILVGLAGAPRELYSVHRLLDLLQARYGSEGKMMEATLLHREVSGIRTRQLLVAVDRDFTLARKGNGVDNLNDIPLQAASHAPANGSPNPKKTPNPPTPKEPTPAVNVQPPAEKPKSSPQITISGPLQGAGVYTLQRNMIWYQHRFGPMPGQEGNLVKPLMINGKQWVVTWVGKETKPYLGLVPPFMPPADREIVASTGNQRDEVKVMEYPTSANNYKLAIFVRFHPIGPDEPDRKIEIRW
jgi:hypothetical protein